MLVLDTPVLAALMQSDSDERIVRWLDAQAPASVWTTTLTVAELLAGLEQLDDATLKARAQAAFGAVLSDDLGGRVLSFDQTAAQVAALVSADERRAGRTLETRDAFVAGIVIARRATLATLDTTRFARLGVRTVDPRER